MPAVNAARVGPRMYGTARENLSVPAVYPTASTKRLNRAARSVGSTDKKPEARPFGFGFFKRALLRGGKMPQQVSNEARLLSVGKLLTDLEQQKFFGSLELKLEAGRVVLIRKTETIKPNCDYRENRGTCNERKV